MDRRVFNNPVHSEQIDRILACLDVTNESLVLDVGCGRAEMLARLAERSGCHVVGVDPDEQIVKAARVRLDELGDRAVLHPCRIADLNFASEQFDVAICVGAVHAYGDGSEGLHNTFVEFSRLVRPGGTIMIGDGYWRTPPAPEYLAATGLHASDHGPYGEVVRMGERMGWIPTYTAASSPEDWDHFESLTWLKAEDELRENPDSQEAHDKAVHWRQWRDHYFRWGRDTLGFAVHLFRKPAFE